MKLEAALKSHTYVKRQHWDSCFCYYEAGTGPYSKEGSGLVDCDYFVFIEDGIKTFSTSIDLYAEDIMADDYIIAPTSDFMSEV